MGDIKLTDEQSAAALSIQFWFEEETHKKQTYVLSGYAGTGKTFLVRFIIENILELKPENVAYCAPTGKAATVLIQRGAIGASTIHRLIYNRIEIEDEIEGENGKKIKVKHMEFVKKPILPSRLKLIVIDEISMVEEKILNDLLSFGIPILACGDEGQLPAITKDNGLLKKPDFTLTKILRQKEGDGIISVATATRKGIDLPEGYYGENVEILSVDALTSIDYRNILLNADQVLCGTNATRDKLNRQIKSYLGMDPNSINKGEKVICTLNNWDFYLDDNKEYTLVNGSMGYVEDFDIVDGIKKLGKMKFKPDFLDKAQDDVIFDYGIFKDGRYAYDKCQHFYRLSDGTYEIKEPFKPKQPGESDKSYRKRLRTYARIKKEAAEDLLLNQIEPGYVISGHRSQGSEWDFVVVFDESDIFRENKYRWLYTAISRAKKHLIILR